RGQLVDGLLAGPAQAEPSLDAVLVAQVVDQAQLGGLAHRLDAELDPAAATDPLLQACAPNSEAAVVHVPDRERQGVEGLEEVLTEVLLPITPVDRLPDLTQLGQRGQVDVDRTVRSHAAGLRDVAEETALEVEVVDLGSPMRFKPRAHPEAHATTPTPVRSKVPVAHQTAEDDLPLLVGEAGGLADHDPVALDE